MWGYRGRQKSLFVDFETLGAVPKDKLRQAKAARICLKTAPSKADTLLPEDHHYQVSCSPCFSVWVCIRQYIPPSFWVCRHGTRNTYTKQGACTAMFSPALMAKYNKGACPRGTLCASPVLSESAVGAGSACSGVRIQ